MATLFSPVMRVFLGLVLGVILSALLCSSLIDLISPAGSTNITCNCTFVTFCSYLIFDTFDGSIVRLGNTNITSYCTFVTFVGTLIFFFFHLTVLSSHWIVPTSHVTILL